MSRRSKKKQDVEKAELIFGWYGFTLIVMLLVGSIWDYGGISVSEFLWWWFVLSSATIAILFISVLIEAYNKTKEINKQAKQ